MRRVLLCTAAGLAASLGILLSSTPAHGSELKASDPRTGQAPLPIKVVQPVKPAVIDKTEGECSTHGTSINFVDTPKEAAALAKKDQKLVLVLHVSGNFEDPRFT